VDEYLIGIDLGTSSMKTVLFDRNLCTVAYTDEAYPSLMPGDGFCQQDPNRWWQALCHTCRNVLEQVDISPTAVAGIGIDSQSSVALPIDREGNVLYDALPWMDRRATEQSARFESLTGFQQITGNRADASQFGPKMLWFRDERHDIYRKAVAFLHANGYLIYRLTGSMSTDETEAGLSLLCNTRASVWSQDIIEEVGLDMAKLPPIVPSTKIVGRVTGHAEGETGLAEGTPVVAGLMDVIACGVGSGIAECGFTYVTAGTVQNVGLVHDADDFNPNLMNLSYILPGTWISVGALDFSGGVLRWFNDLLGKKDYDEIAELAETAPPAYNPLLFIPYMIGQRAPLWDGDTRGVIFGLNPTTDRQALVRMFIEGCAYATRYIFDTFRNAGSEVHRVIMTGGSTQMRMWNQIFADVTGVAVDIPENMDVSALGAAATAGLGIGLYNSMKDIKALIKIGESYHPTKAHSPFYSRMYDLFIRFFDATRTFYHELAGIRREFPSGVTGRSNYRGEE
jgi:sugar (pentulose or hexulose) kinase